MKKEKESQLIYMQWNFRKIEMAQRKKGSQLKCNGIVAEREMTQRKNGGRKPT